MNIDQILNSFLDKKFVLPAQAIDVSLTGLTPNSIHHVGFDGQVVSALCQQVGQNKGDPLVTDANGHLSFTMYWDPANMGSNTATTSNTASGLNGGYGDAVLGPVIMSTDKHMVVSDQTGTSVAVVAVQTVAANPTASLDIYTESPTTPVSSDAFAQVFYVDPAALQNAVEATITSVDLFFKYKPQAQNNDTGIANPGVNIYVVPTSDGVPSVSKPLTSYFASRLEYSDVITSIDASVATNFPFVNPVVVPTGKSFAVVVVFDGGAGYGLWTARVGEENVLTSKAVTSVSAPNLGGYFELTQSGVTSAPTPLAFTALKMNVYAARFWQNGVPITNTAPEFDLHIRNYEFITYDSATSPIRPVGGEWVFQDKATRDGTAVVTGGTTTATTLNTPFTNLLTGDPTSQYVVFKGANWYNIRKVIAVTNSTVTVDKPFSFTNAACDFIVTPVARMYTTYPDANQTGVKNFLVLANSSANSTMPFANGSTIVGEVSGAPLKNCHVINYLVNEVNPYVYVNTPTGTSFTSEERFDYTSPDGISANVLPTPEVLPIQLYQFNPVFDGHTVLLSRSNEVVMANADSTYVANSSTLIFDLASTCDYEAPFIPPGASDVFFTRFFINNDYTNENTKYGNAWSKHVTTRFSFRTTVGAEDLKVYLHAYRPPATDLKVYAKLYNTMDPDAFDDKDWTLLELTSSIGKYSSVSNTNDMVEMGFSIPQAPNTAYTSPGSVTTTLNSNVITGFGTNFSNVTAGTLVKIYPTLFPNNHMVTVVTGVTNSTSLTIADQVSNNQVVGAGLNLDVIGYPKQAFRNRLNSNVVRYYDSVGNPHDRYDTLAVKIVFLSSSWNQIPRVKSLRGIGVSP